MFLENLYEMAYNGDLVELSNRDKVRAYLSLISSLFNLRPLFKRDPATRVHDLLSLNFYHV